MDRMTATMISSRCMLSIAVSTSLTMVTLWRCNPGWADEVARLAPPERCG
jgi:hypothetical protein